MTSTLPLTNWRHALNRREIDDVTFMECLQRVVLEDWKLLPESGGTVSLEEPGVMKVQVSGLTEGSVVLRMEGIIALSGLDKGPWQRSCDYVIVSPDGDNVRVLFVELKETMTNQIRGFKQLRWSLLRLEYLRSLCRIHCGYEADQAVVRYALVTKKGNSRLDKQHVKHGRPPPDETV